MANNDVTSKPKVLITGATGFVGSHLAKRLSAISEFHSIAAVRSVPNDFCIDSNNVILTENISEQTDWRIALKGCEVVIHTIARVHVMDESADNPLHEFRQVNVLGTMNLARQAAAQGIKRFIFISSIKVNGEETQLGRAYGPEDIPSPQEPYAISKFEAEQGLLALSKETGMEVVIIRPTIIYGGGVKGNFQQMVACVLKNYPFPFKIINNKRSFVSVYNLVDLIIRCIDHPQAVNRIFLVSDGEDVSIASLLQYIGKAWQKRVLLLPVPHWVLKLAGKVTGQEIVIQRLCGSLQVDISKTCELLDWKPKMTMHAALLRMVEESRSER